MANDIVFGIRPVAEAIQTGKQIERLYIRKGAEGQLMTELRDLAFRHRIRIQEVPVEKLNRLTRLNHQGVVAQIAPIEYVELNDILERVERKQSWVNEPTTETTAFISYFFRSGSTGRRLFFLRTLLFKSENSY